jgi:hypothetical protein
MKEKVLWKGFIALLVVTLLIGLYLLLTFNRYGNITSIDITAPKDTTRKLTIDNDKKIALFMKSINRADKQKGMMIINEQLESATYRITIHYKNKTPQHIRLLLGATGTESMYYYENSKITLYELSAAESKKIKEIVDELSK